MSGAAVNQGDFCVSRDKRLLRGSGLLAVVLAVVWISGCTPGNVRHKTGHHESRQAVSVLLMPVDIELSALTAGGVQEVRADWTATAKQLVSDSLRRQLEKYDDQLLEYTEPDDPDTLNRHIQISKLHGVVGKTINSYSVMPGLEPPTKKGSFDWSLGREVSVLKEASGADYGLFIYLRDSYATAGRKAVIVASALVGIGVNAGIQTGFATLVDLNDGNIVWFNRIANQSGDLRTPGAAHSTVSQLIDDIPL
jgi:hypothetical protein